MGIGQADVYFQNEGLQGLAAVGSCLSDVARRFGVKQDKRCGIAGADHSCVAKISRGGGILSPRSDIERDYFKAGRNSVEYRLMCQACIIGEGEVVIMTSAKTSAAAGESKKKDLNEAFKKAFEKMPLEKKIANLVDLEAMTLGDTVSYVLNSPFKVFEKVVDAMAEFGFRKEEGAKAAAGPGVPPKSAAAEGKRKRTPAKKAVRSRKTKKPASA